MTGLFSGKGSVFARSLLSLLQLFVLDIYDAYLDPKAPIDAYLALKAD